MLVPPLVCVLVIAAGRRAPRDVGRDRGLVEEPDTRHVRIDETRIHVAERITGLDVVQVHESGHEDRARLVVAAIERQARVVEHPVGAGPDDRIGGRLKTLRVLEGGEAERRDVLGKSGQQRALPGLAAVGRPEQAHPRVRVHLEAAKRIEGTGQVHRAVVVHPRENVQRIACRYRARWFVLALQVRIPVRERVPDTMLTLVPGTTCCCADTRTLTAASATRANADAIRRRVLRPSR